MPFEVTTTRTFAATHQLKLYDGSMEPKHGHQWVVRVRVASAKLDSMGVVIDFHELERLVDALAKPMDNRHLNDLAPFQKENPSAENVAQYIGRNLGLPSSVKLLSVEVWEEPTNSAIFRP